MREAIDAKRAIGGVAARMVEPGMTLYVDGGSTVQYCIEQIDARPLQVVTNSLTAANHFAGDERVELLVVGGAHYPRTGVLIGPITTAALSGLHADVMLFSGAGLYEAEVFNSSLEMAEVERLVGKIDGRLLVLYGRVSGHGQKDDLDVPLQRLQAWSATERKGVETLVLSEIGSGPKASRRQLQRLRPVMVSAP